MMIDYLSICNDFLIKLELDFQCGFKDGGASTNDTIMLYPCSEEWIKELSFWHELGHILLIRSMSDRTHHFSTLSKEFAAWEFGLNIAYKYGRNWDYNSIELKWARKQLASYVNGEYDDLKEFYNKS